MTKSGGGASDGDSKATLSGAITSDTLRELATDPESFQQLQPHLQTTNEDTATDTVLNMVLPAVGTFMVPAHTYIHNFLSFNVFCFS